MDWELDRRSRPKRLPIRLRKWGGRGVGNHADCSLITFHRPVL